MSGQPSLAFSICIFLCKFECTLFCDRNKDTKICKGKGILNGIRGAEIGKCIFNWQLEAYFWLKSVPIMYILKWSLGWFLQIHVLFFKKKIGQKSLNNKYQAHFSF